LEDALQDGEAAVDRGHARTGGAQLGTVLVDHLTRDVAQAEPPEVGDDPPVEQVGVGGERRRLQRGTRVFLPPLLEERCSEPMTSLANWPKSFARRRAVSKRRASFSRVNVF
jgi:hypothetical protein